MKFSQDTTLDRAGTTASQVAQWAQALRQLHARIAPRFARAEPRQRVLRYLQALLSSVERKNGWQLAEQAREGTPYGYSVCSPAPSGMLIWCVTTCAAMCSSNSARRRPSWPLTRPAFPNAATSRRACRCNTVGRLEKRENCQVGVFLAYITAKGHSLIDRELYLPDDWTTDPKRSQEAHIPESVRFQTKPELAVQMMERLHKAHLPISWVVADSVYGGNLDLRTWLQEHEYAYVLAMACDEPVGILTPEGARRRVEVREVEALLPGSSKIGSASP